MSKKAQEIENRFNAKFEEDFEPIYYANGFSFPKMPVITSAYPNKVNLLDWGLIPKWTKSTNDAQKFRANTLNAKSETIFEKPSFRFSIYKKRCLVLSSGFFEWRAFKNKKYPYFIGLKNSEIFTFAGIYEEWLDKYTGELFNTFSIITCSANEVMSKIHNSKKRMPVILLPNIERKWLEPNLSQSEITSLLSPCDSSELAYHTISRRITDRWHNTNVPEITDEYVYEELVE